jgi:tripartite-type tricarboxylate transporter receptor subunit TctC
MPKAIVQKLNAEIVRIMAMPEIKERFASFGTDAASSTPQDLARFLAEEVKKIAHVAASVGAKTN